MQAQLLRKTPLAIAIAALGLVAANPAAAFKFETENGLQGSFDSTISVGLTQRLKSPDKSIIGQDSGGTAPVTAPLGELVNGAGNGWTSNPDFNYTQVDDGDQNYKKGQVVSSVLKGTHEFFLKRQGDWAGLARFTWSSDFSSPDTQRTPLDPEAKRAVERNISLLDLWVSKEVSFGDNAAKIKVGNQVISWGEDIFFMGGVNTINAIDIRKAHIPGAQLKELFIPAPMISLATGLGAGLSAEAYYQVRWNKFIFDPSGTYWSGADFIGKGGKRGAFIPSSFGGIGDFDPTRGRTLAAIDAVTIPSQVAPGGRVPVEIATPKNSGQYGFNLRFKPKDSDTEYAAYYIRYHDKLPFVGFRQDLNAATAPNIAGYTAIEQYGEDKELFGLSLNTKLGEWAIGAELSYRPRDSVAIDPTVPSDVRATGGVASIAKPQYNLLTQAIDSLNGIATVNGYVEEKKWQAHLTGFKMLGPAIPQALGAAEGYVMTELAVTYYPNLDLTGGIPYLLNNYTLPDRRSWGYVVEGGLTYANIFQSGWTMSPIIDWYHHVKGTSPNTIPFIQGYRAVSVGLNFDLHNVWKVGFNYSTFFGGGNLNLMRDRDVISASASYTF